MTRQLNRMAAVEGGAAATDVKFLGSLLWYTVSDVLKIPIEDLRQSLQRHGLELYMPRKINPRDAFRRVTKSFEIRRDPYGKGTYVNLLVRDVKYGEGEVIRHLVREVVDGQNKRLDYIPVLQLEINSDERLVITPLMTPLTQTEQNVMDSLPQAQEQACNYYDGTHIRYMLTLILQNCDPVSVRPSGGVSFVPQKHADTVTALKELCKELNNYEGRAQMYSVPVIDAEEHRIMVADNLEEQVINGSLSLIEEMKQIIENPSKKPTTRLAESYANKVKGLKEQVSAYEEMLEIQATNARENLELVKIQAVKFLELVAEEGDE